MRGRRCSRTRSGWLVLVVGVALAVLPGPASAATARLVDVPPGASCKPGDEPVGGRCPVFPPGTALVFQGGREANRIVVSRVRGSSAIRLRDAGAAIHPGEGCSREADRSVTCSQPSAAYIFVAAGAGADRVRMESIRFAPYPGATDFRGLWIDGGPGHDVLVGGPGSDQLYGGQGSDRLRGRDGDDALHDSSVRDFLPERQRLDPRWPPLTLPAGRRPDTFDGGRGEDSISFEGRRANLRINLADRRPIAGARGERDRIRRTEHVTAGAGDDRIAGNGSANRLYGQEGNDLIVGRAGDDHLEGAEGRNVLRGGLGDDRLNSLSIATPDRISCGLGRDSVDVAFHYDFLSDNCETLSLGQEDQSGLSARLMHMHLPLRAGRPPRVMSGSAACFAGGICHARLELRVHGPAGRRGTAPPAGTVLGTQTFATNASQAVDLGLSPDGARLLRRHGALLVRIAFATQHAGATPPGFVTILRDPPRAR